MNVKISVYVEYLMFFYNVYKFNQNCMILNLCLILMIIKSKDISYSKNFSSKYAKKINFI